MNREENMMIALIDLKRALGDAIPEDTMFGEIPPLTRPLSAHEAQLFNEYVNLIEPWEDWT